MVSIVHEGAPGDSIVFSVSRAGFATDISITVGELPADGHPHSKRRHRHMGKRAHGYGHGHLGHMNMGKGMLGGAHDSLITSESRYLTDGRREDRPHGGRHNAEHRCDRWHIGTVAARRIRNAIVLHQRRHEDFRARHPKARQAIADLSANTDATTMVMQVTNEDGTQQVHLVAQGNFAKQHRHRHQNKGE